MRYIVKYTASDEAVVIDSLKQVGFWIEEQLEEGYSEEDFVIYKVDPIPIDFRVEKSIKVIIP